MFKVKFYFFISMFPLTVRNVEALEWPYGGAKKYFTATDVQVVRGKR